ncbi:MAG TPA: sugar phosphate isomerase/epimerase family protein [Tepidisphaeraceae bacterium]|jgi:sugar phosphate isomerase/epimerase|nr:sugar phosphate isomerase/epimerase family protein [Tepidisphaeraceae bacterium]
MPIRTAFSTVACPKWDFETIASRAKEYGYEGVEIRGFLNESILTASNVFLTDPAKLKSLFTYHGIKIACLASSIAMTGNKRRDRKLADDCRRFIDTAAAVDCGLVKIFDTEVHPGQSRASAGIAFGDWLVPLGDYAAQHDITIVVENTLSFRDAKEMWLILDRVSHPSIAACWDVFNASLIGEPPSISVPVLNNKIQYVQVQDATIGALGATYTKLGEGEVPVEKFIRRLLGIGYEGWITFEWEKAWLPNIAEPEDVLPDAVKKLQNWINPPEEEDPKAKKKPAAAKA